ncbi:PTS ascorbate transporter subunit IIC [Amantichitinum ursilacus]|uniref:Ascorbate-specific PTS system EIIC component n=1 Tax=Amantichitinum ursilacus TaxID=857265 RepID=A0A0N1JTL5_9NEIS|nr:PTS ascorbate transporter subunit IIC [Amantichitinum ursilacus]KPC54858.1 Ascorbate-specific permease IIC component UlaA [Amantichitinum ursilacus]
MIKFILDILSDPAILIGIFALLGLLLQKAKVADVVAGTIKTILGFVILGAGAQILVGSLDIFRQVFDHAFGLKGTIPNNEAIVALSMKQFGSQTAYVMILGMLVNLLLARLTPLKYIFLTGHHTLFMACLLVAVMSAGGMTGVPLVLVGGAMLGLLMVIMPALTQPFTRKVTGSDSFALGHFGSFGYIAAALVGKVIGKKGRSTEDIKVPESLRFLRDTSISMALTMGILFIVVSLVAGPTFIETSLSGGVNFLVFSIKQALVFSAGVYIILAGVRLLIAEIVPAFKGISDKLIPNAKPALDCPAVFPFAPNAVVIGFMSSFVGGLVAMFITPALGLAVIVPGLIPHFFTGATAGVYGNATGGLRGAVFGAFVNGVLISFLPAVLLTCLGAIGFAGTTFGDTDFSVVGILLSFVMRAH